MLRGEQHLGQQAFEDAAYAYHQALLLAPDHRYARFWLGESLFHLGRYADTVAVLTDLEAGNDTALALEHALTLGRALQLIGNAALAEVTLLQAFVAHPDSEAAAYNLAVFYAQENQPAQALQFLEPSVQFGNERGKDLEIGYGVNVDDVVWLAQMPPRNLNHRANEEAQ